MRICFAALVAALLSCLFVPSASAETSSCNPYQSEGNGTVNIFLVAPTGEPCTIARVVTQLAGAPVIPTQTGFFRVFGPNGHISDSQTKFWTSSESYRAEVNQKTHEGTLWCSEFWMQTGSTFTRADNPVCIEL
ncbi:hypothetical protein [Lentzea sp. NBRC 102530]|uniref:hypothetical protein n=1 Tax=Lentzea sp. NBRC 102530 TaxID=3032201 RepID=UPI0024A1EC26|nr:hypothetical protein [Lentzea sp. NBRC 102530]GLY54290.1 hypothetical protein Lesp01_79460 [Lentzea sp. NBRC 102530]